MLIIRNQTKKTVLARQAQVADTFSSRMLGLIPRDKLLSEEALIITRCNSIHMFFMRFPIDVVFVDNQKKVVGLVKNIKPFQMSRMFWKASFAIELPVGVIDTSNTQAGDDLEWY